MVQSYRICSHATQQQFFFAFSWVIIDDVSMVRIRTMEAATINIFQANLAVNHEEFNDFKNRYIQV